MVPASDGTVVPVNVLRAKLALTGSPLFLDRTAVGAFARPFEDASRMTTDMVQLWNLQVGDHDIVYVLGDFMGPATDRMASILASLNGAKVLVVGDKDRLSSSDYLAAGFEEVYRTSVLVANSIVLSYRPVQGLHRMWNLHGGPGREISDLSTRHISLRVENWGYAPVPFDTIWRRIEQQESVLQEEEKRP
jgi:calcineurin-like phosphoesterase family protein